MHELLNAAIARRVPLMNEQTTALRLVDGEGDGLPDLILETFAGHDLLSSVGSTLPAALRSWIIARGRPCYWKQLDPQQKSTPSHLAGAPVNEPFLIRENDIAFEISFQSGYSQGLFLDQRNNRARVRQRAAPGLRILNTFAYTGGFSVAAAMGGAQTTTLDLSQPYLDWAKRNFLHNGLDPQTHHFCRGDTFHWLRRFAKQGRRFDGIILDPPTFSRDPDGRIFRAGDDFGQLAALATKILEPGGWLLCCTNFRGISPAAFERQILNHLPRPMTPTHTPMPPDFTATPYLKSLWLRAERR